MTSSERSNFEAVSPQRLCVFSQYGCLDVFHRGPMMLDGLLFN